MTASEKSGLAQLSLWDEEESHPCEEHSIKVIYFTGQRAVYRIGSPEWEEVENDRNVWSAEFVRNANER